MIRRVGHTLKFATVAKQQKLDSFFDEYARVVNAFIVLYWNKSVLPGKANSVVYNQVDSWMMGKARKCAVNQAIRILKSVAKKDRQKKYKAYQKAYAKAKKHNRDVLSILSLKWADWSKGRVFRHRVQMPIFKGNTIDLNSDLVHIQDASSSLEFDLWVRLGSIFGNRESLVLPTKHHERSRHFEKTGWAQRKSLTLRRDAAGRYYADLYWEKAEPQTSQQESAVGVDIGINKLVTCSDGTELGLELKSKLDRLNRRKQNSRNWNQTRKEIKDYIGYVTNRFPWSSVDVIVMENILNITKSTRGRLNKTVRKMLGHWNVDLLYRRMQDKAEENRVLLAFVEPAYTSQTCNSCGAIDKKSRSGEVFKCTTCVHADDADHNASLNILQRFLDGQFTVARGTQRV